MPARVHPAFFAASVVLGIGLAIYTYWSGNKEREKPHGHGPPPPRSPPPTQPQTQSPDERSPKKGHRRTGPNKLCIRCLIPLSKKPILQLQCTHSFHKDCLRTYAQNSDVCPSCPERLPSGLFNNEHKASSEKDK